MCDRAFERLQIRQRVVAGDRLDAAHARGHAALGDNLEQPDVAGALHMRTAAQLAAAADVEHAHFVAILLAEQHHRAGFLRLVYGHHASLRGSVREDLGVHDRLDLRDLLGRHRRVVREVEARALRVHERALLLHMVAKHLAQRLVHQVGG